MDETVKGAIKEAKERLDLQTEKLDIHPFILEKYGKSECKKWKISPDSLMQLGFQVRNSYLEFLLMLERC